MRQRRRMLLRMVALTAVSLQSVAGASTLALSPDKETLACLVQPQAALPYPEGLAERKHGAVVRARMSFTAPDASPTVEIFYNSGLDDFANAVATRLKAYRLPCLAAGTGPVTATQEFRFSPADERNVVWSSARGEATRERHEDAERCISVGEGKPGYPKLAMLGRSRPPQGTVLAAIRFAGVDQPPQVTILFDGGNGMFADVIQDHVAKQYRATCVPRSGFPLEGLQSFKFSMEGEKEYRFKDLPLRDFVGALKEEKTRGPVFDLDSMACPFEVQLHVYRPYADNSVGEIGGTNANRREFMEWLKKATLNLGGDAAKQLIGGSMKVSIPCGKLDLS